jgi:hypothetical protein
MSERTKNSLLLGLLLFLAVVFFYFHWPHENPILPVAGYHFYLSRQIYQGEVLYRDLFIDKPPLTEMFGAGCFLLCSGKLIPSVIMTRWLFFLIYLFSAVPLYLISRHFFKQAHLSLLVVLTFLSFNFPYEKLAVSSDWHVLMLFFGLVSLALFLRGWIFMAGLAVSLSAISWQPGLIFLIALLLSLSLSLPGCRRKKSVKILAGFFIPVCIMVIYAWIRGSLPDLIEQTILYGRINVGSEFLDGIGELPRRVMKSYSRSIPIIILGLGGYIISWFLVARNRTLARRFIFPLSLFTMMIIIDLVDKPSSRHIIPALPWISVYAVFLIDWLPGKKLRSHFRIALIVCLLGLIGYSLPGTVKNRPGPQAMEKQQMAYLALLERHGYREGDSIFCMESVLPALFAGEKNLSRHVYCLEEKHYHFIQLYEEGGFDAIVRLIERDHPRLIYIGKQPWSHREWHKKRFNPLREFLSRRYRLIEDRRMWLYVDMR